jgi:hypothetical protein
MTIRTLAAALVLLLFTTPAHAASYVKADFSSGVLPGDANVRDPLRDPFFQGDIFTGSFVYDQDLVPAAGSGFVNVFFNSYADITSIPAADAFKFTFGPYQFTLADDPLAMVQYNNGGFNGFIFNTVFAFEGVNYQFSMNGGSIKVNSVADPFGQPFLNGYTNIGNQALTNATPYTIAAPGAVPEPATWAMMLLGLGFVGGVLRTRRRQNRTAAHA